MTELQNDRMTNRTKTIFSPIFDLGGKKKTHSTKFQALFYGFNVFCMHSNSFIELSVCTCFLAFISAL